MWRVLGFVARCSLFAWFFDASCFVICFLSSLSVVSLPGSEAFLMGVEGSLFSSALRLVGFLARLIFCVSSFCRPFVF